MTVVPPPLSSPDSHEPASRLTSRDRKILRLLADHSVLSTSQIAAAFFYSLRSAQQRLTILHRLQFVSRHSFYPDRGGKSEFLYSSGPLAARYFPPTVSDLENFTRPMPRSHIERVARLIASSKTAHTVGVNGFFTGLLAHTRHVDGDSLLIRWWNEKRATENNSVARVRPDAGGIWRKNGRTVGFWLEHDTGTENHARVLDKLGPYRTLAGSGPRYPVLLWVHSQDRLDRLAAKLPVEARLPIALAVHQGDSAGPIWRLVGDDGPLRALHELPTDHGPSGATNPHRFTDR